MNDKLSLSDLSEMLGFAYSYEELGAVKVQMDAAHVVEILERLIAWENSQ